MKEYFAFQYVKLQSCILLLNITNKFERKILEMRICIVSIYVVLMQLNTSHSIQLVLYQQDIIHYCYIKYV